MYAALATVDRFLSGALTSVAPALAQSDGGVGTIIASLISLAIAVVIVAGEWKVYSKAGQPGWAVLIPIYNAIVFMRIVNRPWWWILLMAIPVVNFIIAIIVCIDLAKVFGKGTGFGIGLILLSPIFICILGYGSAQYVGQRQAPAVAGA